LRGCFPALFRFDAGRCILETIMDQDYWKRVRSVLDDALTREGAEREAFVDRFCKQNPEMGADLRSLLRTAEGTRGAADKTTITAWPADHDAGRPPEGGNPGGGRGEPSED
jgi:hypothetical protein